MAGAALAVEGADDVIDLAGAEDRIDFGNLRPQFLAVALGKAAGDHQPARPAVRLVLGHLEDGVDRLLLGRVDERTRVHHQHVGLGGLARDLVPGTFGKPQHHLGIDEVLGAAEGNQSNFH